ncbi:hypothetical protein Btru_027809 [Bulinus truncatus]|nr:hypothetical protein Btru_027809 [Bulinus truncatus]
MGFEPMTCTSGLQPMRHRTTGALSWDGSHLGVTEEGGEITGRTSYLSRPDMGKLLPIGRAWPIRPLDPARALLFSAHSDLEYILMILFGIDVSVLDNYIKKSGYVSHCRLPRCYRIKSYVSQRFPGAVKPHQIEHVRWVLRKSKDTVYQSSLSPTHGTFTSLMNKSKKLKFFTNLPFFKYPTKILMVVVLQIVTLYLISVAVIGYVVVLSVEYFSRFIQGLLKLTGINIIWQPSMKHVDEISGIFQACVVLALVVSVLQAVIYIVMFLRNYRYHSLKLYQGDKQFTSDFKNPPGNILVSNMNCVGYTFVYFIMGFVFTFIGLCIAMLVVSFGIYVSALRGHIGELFKWLAFVLSFPVLALILRVIMQIACKRILLQRKLDESDKNPPLNVDNRKLYEVVSYYYLYLSMAQGLTSCVARFLLSAAFGFFSMGRLDKSIYPRDLQKFDGAHATYVAMLQVDHAHNNPSLRLFAHLLWSDVLVARLRNAGGSHKEIDHLIAILNHRVTGAQSSIKQCKQCQ